jgi:hypothetical protein
MAIYQVKLKDKLRFLQYLTYRSSNIEETLAKFLGNSGHKPADAESIAFLCKEDRPKEAIGEISDKIESLFLDLHRLANTGAGLANYLQGDKDKEPVLDYQWEVRALIDTIEEKTEQLRRWIDAADFVLGSAEFGTIKKN